jgi:hypothetical protein
MTRRTIVELIAQANATLPDNVIGDISPADVRNMILDFLDTIRPSYAVIQIGSAGVSKAVTAAFSTFAWATQYIAQAPDWTTSLASGTCQRSGGPATTRITFNADVVAPNNSITTFALFVNGVETSFAVSNTSTSSVDKQSFSLAAIVYATEAAIQYQIQVKSTVTGNIVISNAILACENVPVNTNA